MGSRFLPPTYHPTGDRAFDALLFDADRASEEGNRNGVLNAIDAIWGWLDGRAIAPTLPARREAYLFDSPPGRRRIRGLPQVAVAAARHDAQGHHASAAMASLFPVAPAKTADARPCYELDIELPSPVAADETIRTPWTSFVETAKISAALAQKTNATMAEIALLMRQAADHLVAAQRTMADLHAMQPAPA
ncbi:MAG TPA: hypothetical protein VMB71_11065 [Acetobacteraceae bacterium]|nr:hypothetical protein [Acetobacteraceae bacterium]